MYSACEHYPVLCKEMEFECLSTPATIYVIASAQHIAVLVSLRGHSYVSEVPSPDNPHACICEIIAENFYNLAEEYLIFVELLRGPPPPQLSINGKEFIAQFIGIEAILPVFEANDIEDIHVDDRFFILMEEDATIEEFLGDHSRNTLGDTIS